MNSHELISVGKKYPLTIKEDGAIADFLRKDTGANTLIISIANISKIEALALKKGKLTCGIMYKNGALLLLWQYHDKKGQPILTLDSPFDANLIPEIVLHDIKTRNTRLLIEIHVVDRDTGNVLSLRALTMAPALTLLFLSAVQDQLASSIKDKEKQLRKWLLEQPESLIRTVKNYTMGD